MSYFYHNLICTQGNTLIFSEILFGLKKDLPLAFNLKYKNVMKKIFVFIFLSIIFPLKAEFISATLYFNDGTKKTGFAELVGTEDKKLKIKALKDVPAPPVITLDAGANVHLFYKKEHMSYWKNKIENEFLNFQVIWDD